MTYETAAQPDPRGTGTTTEAPVEGDLSAARHLAELLVAEGEAAGEIRGRDRSLGLARVIEDVRAYSQQRDLLERAGVGTPCLLRRSGPPLPVLLGGLPVGERSDERAVDEAGGRAHREVEDGGQPVQLVPGREADGFFVARLAAFLRVRLRPRRAGARERLGTALLPPERRMSASASAPALFPFTARCPQSGLHVFVSPAYVADRRRVVFGETLTTPVVGPLGQGIWVFATARPREREWWEDAEVSVPDVLTTDLDGPA